MPLQVAAQTAQHHQVFGGEIARFGQGHVQGRGRMPLAEDKAVPPFPGGIGRIMAHLVEIEGGNHVDGRQRTAGMPRLGLVERLDDGDAQLPRLFFQFDNPFFHRKSFLSGCCMNVYLCPRPDQIVENDFVEALRLIWHLAGRQTGRLRTEVPEERGADGVSRRRLHGTGSREPKARSSNSPAFRPRSISLCCSFISSSTTCSRFSILMMSA